MKAEGELNGLAAFKQLKKYAKDLSEMYRLNQEKEKILGSTYDQLMIYAESINKINMELSERNKELGEAYIDTIHRLVLAAEFKDEETGNHIVRMSRYSALLAEKLGLPDAVVQTIYYTTPMHDVGKIGIPDSILSKPGKLTDEEFNIMKKHTTIGAKILEGSKADILKAARRIALSHHEKWNGKGYPNGLSKKKIPIEGRIVGLADVFDALTSRRPYKDPYPIEAAIEIINLARGQDFDPDIVDVFLENIEEIKIIKKEVDSLKDLLSFPFEWSERDRQEGIDKKIRV